MTHQHDPSKWHQKIWRYFPIDYNPDEYYKLNKHWLDKIPEMGDNIMDIGCHSGLAVIWLKLNFPEKDIMGIDVNPTVVHFARTRVFLFQKDIPIYLGDGFNLSDYVDKSKDVIFHTGLLEHFDPEERIKMLKEQLRVAKYVLFTVPTDKALEEEGGYGDEHKWSYQEWLEFIGEHFKIKESFGDEKEFACVIEGIFHNDKHPEEEHFTEIRNLVDGINFDRILDLGCGDGYMISKFQDCCNDIMAIDQKEHHVVSAKEKYPPINYLTKDLEYYFPFGTFNLILFCDVIYYLSQNRQESIMLDIYNHLEQDGYLITSRHMGDGDGELDRYNYLFQKLKSKYVSYKGNEKKWCISLWKKVPCRKVRDKEEIQQEIDKILNSSRVMLPVIGAMTWAKNKNSAQIFNLIDSLIQEKENNIDEVAFSLIWCLKLEQYDDSWLMLQQWFHKNHLGADQPDFRLPIMLSWMGIGKEVLDVGVHNGIFSNEYNKLNTVIGIDLPEVIDQFKSKYNFPCFSHDLNKPLVLFEDNKFDVIVAGEIIEHLIHPEVFLDESWRVLKPNGLLLISCPFNNCNVGDPLHCNIITEEWLRNLFKNHFLIEEVKEELKILNGALVIKARCVK